jgi:hypothetical protein
VDRVSPCSFAAQTAGTEGQVGRHDDSSDRRDGGHDEVDVVNGPEDETTDWASIDWRTVEDDVRRLRQRIFTASQAGDHKRVRNLQKLMLRSRANTLLSVRQVMRSTLAARPRASTAGWW